MTERTMTQRTQGSEAAEVPPRPPFASSSFDLNNNENVQEDEQALSPMHKPTLRKRMSSRIFMSPASKAYDRGNKGHLDHLEQIVRGYDVDGDGKISRDEVFLIVKDLEDQRKRKRGYRNGMIGMSAAAIFLLLCVFGLMAATIVLTRKVNVGDGDTLVSDETGHVLSTGHYVPRIALEISEEEAELTGNKISLRSRQLQQQHRRMAVFDNYAGLNYLGRCPKSRWDSLLSQAASSGYKEAALSLASGDDLHICLVYSKIKVVDESDELGGKRHVGIQKLGSGGACDGSVHYLFSCGGTDYLDKCYVYEVLAPVAKVGGTTKNQAKISFRVPYGAQVAVRYNTVNSFLSGYMETVSILTFRAS